MVITDIWADTETRSELDLKKHGTHRYAQHPSTRIQLYSYAFNDGPVNVWSPEEGEPMPKDLKEAYNDPNCIFHFHNAFFDRTLIEETLNIRIPIQRYRCIMAKALSHALPAGLDKLGEVVGLPQDLRKVADGKRLMRLFCQPQKQKDGSRIWFTPQSHPVEWAAYKEYCRTDTDSMRAAAKRIPNWNYQGWELELWFMDQIMNSRGMYMDLDFAEAATEVIGSTQKELAARTRDMTNGEVQAATQRDQMLKHIAGNYGFELPNMQKATLQKIVEDESYPPELRMLIQVRLDSTTSSTAKYKKIMEVTSADSRVRGTIQYSGAARTKRDCLAEGTMVRVWPLEGEITEKPIESVLTTDMVWDGVEWVNHDGVEYRGEKEVIEWDGVPATEDHEVFLSDMEKMTLQEARVSGLRLWEGYKCEG
jgi:DNA polymerase